MLAEVFLNHNGIFVIHSSDGIVWNAPIGVSPEVNIFGEFWLVSEPKPESVIEVEGATSDLVNIPHTKDFSTHDFSDALLRAIQMLKVWAMCP